MACRSSGTDAHGDAWRGRGGNKVPLASRSDTHLHSALFLNLLLVNPEIHAFQNINANAETNLNRRAEVLVVAFPCLT